MLHDPVQARRIVLISIVALLGISAYRGKLNTSSDPFAKRLWGAGVLAIMLGVLADFAPQIAAPFALLVVVGSLTHGGEKSINNFLGKLSGSGAGGGGSVHVPLHNLPGPPQRVGPVHPGTNVS